MIVSPPWEEIQQVRREPALTWRKSVLSKIPPVMQRYGLAILLVAAALGIGLFLYNPKFEAVEFPIFLAAVALTVWYPDRRHYPGKSILDAAGRVPAGSARTPCGLNWLSKAFVVVSMPAQGSGEECAAGSEHEIEKTNVPLKCKPAANEMTNYGSDAASTPRTRPRGSVPTCHFRAVKPTQAAIIPCVPPSFSGEHNSSLFIPIPCPNICGGVAAIILFVLGSLLQGDLARAWAGEIRRTLKRDTVETK
jgi:hypothetical protein